MNNKFKKIDYLNIFLILFFSVNVSLAQIDNSIVNNTPTSIGDSVVTVDSTKSILKSLPFIYHFDEAINIAKLKVYQLSKKEIDFTDYRYTGNVIAYLPFGFLNDLGSLGSPNEPNLYNSGYENISLSVDNISLNNSLNSSTNLNKVQTEDISSIYLAPLTRGFLSGFNNNLVSLLVSTNDSIKSLPISRLKYYQAPNEEGFVDAMFSARVLPKFSLALRLTNRSIDNNYINSEYGEWKFNVKSIYKISDSVFAKLNYYHLKLNTPLNGGIDISQFDQSSTNVLDIYSSEYPVVYSNKSSTTTQNNIFSSIYGKLLPYGTTNFSIGFSENDDLEKEIIDTTANKYINNYKSLISTLEHNLLLGNLSLTLNAGYEKLEISLAELDLKSKMNNYYTALFLSYSLLNKTITPSLFGKYSHYNSQGNNGFGTDVLIKPTESLKLLLGYSVFGKPYSFLESQNIDIDNIQTNKIFFSSLEFELNKLRASISYFNTSSNNSVLPILISESNITKFEYILEEERQSSGININSKIEFWNILSTANINYYWNNKSSYENVDDIFTVNAGLFYVDTLYNDNLNLKTGFMFYLFDNPNYGIYDFQHMRSTSFTSTDNVLSKLSLHSVVNDKLRVDFYLAGRIQDAATFYFIYENILGNNYYFVPYYPMPEGGIRIGLSWDFLD